MSLLPPSKHRAGRQGIWDAIRASGRSGFTAIQLHEATRTPMRRIHDYLGGLIAAGYVKRSEKVLQSFLLIRDIGAEAPRVDKAGVTVGAPEDQMWRAMKMMGGDWNAHDLAVAASLVDSTIRAEAAADYCRIMAQAGYLRIVGNAKPTRYKFVPQKNTGPIPPAAVRLRVVYDPNLGKIVWHPAVES